MAKEETYSKDGVFEVYTKKRCGTKSQSLTVFDQQSCLNVPRDGETSRCFVDFMTYVVLEIR